MAKLCTEEICCTAARYTVYTVYIYIPRSIYIYIYSTHTHTTLHREGPLSFITYIYLYIHSIYASNIILPVYSLVYSRYFDVGESIGIYPCV